MTIAPAADTAPGDRAAAPAPHAAAATDPYADPARWPPPSAVDRGHVADGRVAFPPWRGEADRPSPPPPAPTPPGERVGFAVVGLGRLALDELLPAFAESHHARCTALVSGAADKRAVVARQYGIAPEACFGYADIGRLRRRPDVQAVYIALPNALHRAACEQAAAAGLHVLCEKPMATSAADARAMEAACHNAGVRLMVAYRIHHQPHHRWVRQAVADGRFGRLVAIQSSNCQTVAPDAAAQWRHQAALAGGGALPDIGLYNLNTARFLAGEEPHLLAAWLHRPRDDPRFAEVEQSVAFTLRFPASGCVAQCFTSYGAREDKSQRLVFERATLEMPDAFAYRGQRLLVGGREGSHAVQREVLLPPENQFAAEIDHFARCIRSQREPATPGAEGVRDHVLMEAIYRMAVAT